MLIPLRQIIIGVATFTIFKSASSLLRDVEVVKVSTRLKTICTICLKCSIEAWWHLESKKLKTALIITSKAFIATQNRSLSNSCFFMMLKMDCNNGLTIDLLKKSAFLSRLHNCGSRITLARIKLKNCFF